MYFVALKVTACRDLEAKKEKKGFVQLQTSVERKRILGKMGAGGLEQRERLNLHIWGKEGKGGRRDILIPY